MATELNYSKEKTERLLKAYQLLFFEMQDHDYTLQELIGMSGFAGRLQRHLATLNSTEKNKMRVWWVRNPPAEAEKFVVASIDEAKAKINELTEQDFRRPAVLSNACGLEVFDGEDWCEWESDDGDDINAVMRGDDQ